MKKRRQPWTTAPDYAKANGFSSDLIHDIQATAAAYGQPITYLKKNGDTYIAVRLPDADELKQIDAATPEAAE